MFVVSHRLKCQPVLAVLGLNLIGAFSSKEKPRLTFESFPSQSRRLFRGATQSILNAVQSVLQTGLLLLWFGMRRLSLGSGVL